MVPPMQVFILVKSLYSLRTQKSLTYGNHSVTCKAKELYVLCQHNLNVKLILDAVVYIYHIHRHRSYYDEAHETSIKSFFSFSKQPRFAFTQRSKRCS